MGRPPLEPGLWASLASAAGTVREASGRGRSVVWGHDDLDGAASTAIVLKALGGIGGRAAYYIPPKSALRHGLDPVVLKEIASRNTSLLVTVDCGIGDAEEVQMAEASGMAVVVSDHHELPGALPRACSVVDPKIAETPRPTSELAGCGVALYLSAALAGRSGTAWMEGDRESLAWATLGTVSDRVPLVDENRELVRAGLPALAELPVVSMVSGLAGFDLSSGLSPGILRRTLVPLLSMAESQGSRHEIVELLRGDIRPGRISELAELRAGRDRELELWFNKILSESDPGLPYFLVIVEDIPPGSVGSLASMLRDRTGKPALVASLKDGLMAGECRGRLPFDFVEYLGSMSRVFRQHGGHKQAAGFTVARGSEDDFRRLARQGFEERRKLIPGPEAETAAEFDLAGPEDAAGLGDALAARAPFGPGNPMPKAAFRSIKLPLGASPAGAWKLDDLLACQADGVPAWALRAELDVTHTGSIMVNFKS